MQRTAIVAVLLMIGVGVAGAANLFTSPWTGQSGTYTPTLAPVTITQNLDPSQITPVAVHCGLSTGEHAANSYTRRYFLFLDHGITQQFDVVSVDFGIETAFSNATPTPATGQPLDINLYTIAAGAPFLFGNLTLIGTETILIPNDGSADGQFFNVVISGTVADPINLDLVVEEFTPSGQDPAELFALWPGANSLGETQPSYLAAADCGITEPTPVSAIGFPDMHLIQVINGDEGGGTVPVIETGWDALKSLFE